MSVNASSFYTSPWYAFDGNTGTLWNSGGFAPQWIEADLGATYSVKKIRLTIEQSPAVQSATHVITINGVTVATLSGTFTSGSTIEADLLNAPTNGRFVRVTTTASNSWIAWREIAIYE